MEILTKIIEIGGWIIGASLIVTIGWYLIIFCLYYLFYIKCETMNFFGWGERICVFSGFSGRATLYGKPASGAIVVRETSWRDKGSEIERIVANENGDFLFESKWVFGMRMPLSEFRAFQRILVQYNDEEYSIWSGAKGWPEEFSEFGGEAPLNLCCELSDEAERIELENINCEFISTSCKWNLASTLDESIAL